VKRTIRLEQRRIVISETKDVGGHSSQVVFAGTDATKRAIEYLESCGDHESVRLLEGSESSSYAVH